MTPQTDAAPQGSLAIAVAAPFYLPQYIDEASVRHAALARIAGRHFDVRREWVIERCDEVVISLISEELRVLISLVCETSSLFDSINWRDRYVVDIIDASIHLDEYIDDDVPHSAFVSGVDLGFAAVCAGYMDHVIRSAEALPDRVVASRYRESLSSTLHDLKWFAHEIGARLTSAVRAGFALIDARANTPLGPFMRVLPDQFRYFDSRWPQEFQWDEYWQNMDEFREERIKSMMISETGDRLFSVVVSPGSSSAGGSSRHVNRSAAERECVRLLSDILAGAETRTADTTKARLLDRAQTEIRGLSKKAFERAFGLATASAAATNWRKGGAPRRRASETHPHNPPPQ